MNHRLILFFLIIPYSLFCSDQKNLSFEESNQTFRSMRTYEIALADIDNDGDLDAVFSNMERYNSTIWLNDGQGNFQDSGQRLIYGSHGAAFSDVDNDGDPDMFLIDNDQSRTTTNKLYINDGTGTFSDSDSRIGIDDMNGNSVRIADINNDGILDLYIHYYGASDKVYLGDGKGVSIKSDMEFPDQTFCFWGDIDQDGDTDLVQKVIGEGLYVLLNDGTGNFTLHWSLENREMTNGDIALIDVDEDSDLDLFVPMGDKEKIFPSIVLLNDGTGLFTDSGQELPGAVFSKSLAADFNNDGFEDLLYSNMYEPLILLLNDGLGRFFDSGIDFGKGVLSGVSAVGDLDNDGDLDIFYAGYFKGGNRIWFNRMK